MLPVCEIFNSIDGEGVFAGHLAVFVRLYGCNLRCSYCDTQYSCLMDKSKLENTERIIKEIKRLCPNCNRVTITGGEPLLHGEALSEFISDLNRHFGISNGLHINIETNGSYKIDDYLLDNVTITMDCKSPSSGCFDRMLGHNLDVIRPDDVLKFVVREEDFSWLNKFLRFARPRCRIFISPVFGKCDPVKIVELMKNLQKDDDVCDIIKRSRFQLQLHKIIWEPDKRGV